MPGSRHPSAISLLALLGLASLALAAPAGASHLEDPRKGLKEVGFHDLGGDGFNTDVVPWRSKRGRVFAASGTWGTLTGGADPGQECPSEADDPEAPTQSGVKIVDATRPGKPTMAARIGTAPGAQNNDIKVLRINAGAKAGKFERNDILVHSLEPCGADGALSQVDAFEDVPRAQTGFQLYDVSDPTDPAELGTYNNGGLGTHNLYPFNRPDRGRAFVAAVFNELPLAEDLLFGEGDLRGELQLIDITDPNDPQPTSTWELSDAEEQGGPGFDDLCKRRGTHIPSCNLHDVWTSPNGKLAYLSFWDAGLIVLNIRNPEKPRFAGQVQSGSQDAEGNTHAAVPLKVGGRKLAIVGDEDFVGGALPAVEVNTPPELAGVNAATPWDGTGPVTGQKADFVYAGTGCTAADYAGVDAAGKIALVDAFTDKDGVTDCPAFTFQQKMDAAQSAGAIGLVQIDDDDEASGGSATSAIPGMEILNSDGIPIRDEVTDGDSTPVNATLNESGVIDPWGFMRVIDATRPSRMKEAATFKAPHVRDPEAAAGDVFSAHNPIVGPDGRIYFSWYTDGVRVLKLARRGKRVRQLAWFAPRPSDHPDDNDTDPHGAQEDNIGFWGSWPICHPNGKLLVFNSDLNRGMYILRATYKESCRRSRR